MGVRQLIIPALFAAVSCAEPVDEPDFGLGPGEHRPDTGADGAGDGNDGSGDASSDASDGGDSSGANTASSSGGSTGGQSGAAGCGNAAIDSGEQCDGSNLNGFDCTSLGYNGGTLACDGVTCTFDTSMCMTGGGTSGHP